MYLPSERDDCAADKHSDGASQHTRCQSCHHLRSADVEKCRRSQLIFFVIHLITFYGTRSAKYVNRIECGLWYVAAAVAPTRRRVVPVGLRLFRLCAAALDPRQAHTVRLPS